MHKRNVIIGFNGTYLRSESVKPQNFDFILVVPHEWGILRRKRRSERDMGREIVERMR